MSEWIAKHQAYAVAWGIIIPKQLPTLNQRKAVRAHCQAYAAKQGYSLCFICSPDVWHLISHRLDRPSFAAGTLQECMLHVVKRDQELLPTP
jgi:hypothetical protein